MLVQGLMFANQATPDGPLPTIQPPPKPKSQILDLSEKYKGIFWFLVMFSLDLESLLWQRLVWDQTDNNTSVHTIYMALSYQGIFSPSCDFQIKIR